MPKGNIGMMREFYDQVESRTPYGMPIVTGRPSVTLPYDFSKYDIGFSPSIYGDIGNQQLRYRGRTQPTADKFGNMLLRGVVGAAVATVEPFGYLADLNHIFSKFDPESESYGNSFNDALMSMEDSLRENFPVYTAKEKPAIFSADWFLANGDQAIRSLGYFVPGMVLTKIASKGLGLIGKGFYELDKYRNAAATLSAANPGIMSQLGEAFTVGLVNRIGAPAASALANNYSEHMVSAVMAYKENRQIYFDAIKKNNPGTPDEIAWREASIQAANDAESIVEGGKWNTILETIEYVNLFKVPGVTRSFTRPSIAKSLGAIAFTAGSEGWQEVNTGFLEDEARRQSAIASGHMEDDGTDPALRYFQRLGTYESLTEGLLGAIGGAGMQVISELMSYPARKQYLEQEAENASTIGDYAAFNKIQEEEFIDILYKNARRGTFEDVDKKLNILSELSTEDIIKLGLDINFKDKLAKYKAIAKEFETEYGFLVDKYDDPDKIITMQHLRMNSVINREDAKIATKSVESVMNKFTEEEKNNPAFASYILDLEASALEETLKYNSKLLSEIPRGGYFGGRSLSTNETAGEIEARSIATQERVLELKKQAEQARAGLPVKEVNDAYAKFNANKVSSELAQNMFDKALSETVASNSQKMYDTFRTNDDLLTDYITRYAEGAQKKETEEQFNEDLAKATLADIPILKDKYKTKKQQTALNKRKKELENEAGRKASTASATSKRNQKKTKEVPPAPPAGAPETKKPTQRLVPEGSSDDVYEAYLNKFNDLRDRSNSGETVNSDDIIELRDAMLEDDILDPNDKTQLFDIAMDRFDTVVKKNRELYTGPLATMFTEDLSTANLGETEIAEIIEDLNGAYYGIFDELGQPNDDITMEDIEETINAHERRLSSPFADNVKIKNILEMQHKTLVEIRDGVRKAIDMQQGNVTSSEAHTESNLAAEDDSVPNTLEGEPNDDIDEDAGITDRDVFDAAVTREQSNGTGHTRTSKGFKPIFRFRKTVETASTLAYLSKEYTTRITLKNGRIVEVGRFTTKNTKNPTLVKLVESHTKVQAGDKLRFSIDEGFEAYAPGSKPGDKPVLTYKDLLNKDGSIDPDMVPIMVEAFIDGDWTFMHYIHNTEWITAAVGDESINTAEVNFEGEPNVPIQEEMIKSVRQVVLDKHNKAQGNPNEDKYTYGEIANKDIGIPSLFVKEESFLNLERLQSRAGRPEKASKLLKDALPEKGLTFGVVHGDRLLTSRKTSDSRVDWFFEKRGPVELKSGEVVAPKSLDGILMVVVPSPVKDVYVPFPIEHMRLKKNPSIVNTVLGVIKAYYSTNPNSLDAINKELEAHQEGSSIVKGEPGTLANFLAKYIYLKKKVAINNRNHVSMFSIEGGKFKFAVNGEDTVIREISDEVSFAANATKLTATLNFARFSSKLDWLNTEDSFLDLRLDVNGNINRKSTKVYDNYNEYLRNVLRTSLNGTNQIEATGEYTYFDQPHIFFQPDTHKVIIETPKGEETTIVPSPEEEKEAPSTKKRTRKNRDNPLVEDMPVSRYPMIPDNGNEEEESIRNIASTKSILVRVNKAEIPFNTDITLQYTGDTLKGIKVSFTDRSMAIINVKDNTVKYYGGVRSTATLIKDNVSEEEFIKAVKAGSPEAVAPRKREEQEEPRKTITLYGGDNRPSEYTVDPIKLTGAKQGYRFVLIDGSYFEVETNKNLVYFYGKNASLARTIQRSYNYKDLLYIGKNWGKTISDMSSLGKLEGDLLETERGQIGVNKQQLMMLLGPTMYNKPLAQVAIKELLQNSFDAIKARINVTDNKETGNIDITVDYTKRVISVKDDGIGMTPEIVKNAFLSIGGTNKEGLSTAERSGGLGLAKVQFLLGSEYVKVVTVRDGIKTTIDATATQLYNDDFDITKEETTEPNGSYVEVKIPQSYTTVEGATREISFPSSWSGYEGIDILTKPLVGNVNMTFTKIVGGSSSKTTLKNGANIDEALLPPLFANIQFSWGTADLHMSIKKVERPKHRVLSSGIFQFNDGIRISPNEWNDIPYDIVINVKPSVPSNAEQYPFNNQREGWKTTVKEDINSLHSYVRQYYRGESEKEAKEVFQDITGLPRVDPNKVLTPEEREKLQGEINSRIEENQRLRREKGLGTVEEEVARIFRNIDIGAGEVTDRDSGEKIDTKEKRYGSSFTTDREIEQVTAIDTENFNPNFPQFHNNTNVDFISIPGAAEFFSDFGSVVLEMVRFVGQDLGSNYRKLTSKDEKFFAGVSIDKGYGGVHVRKIINAIFVNPLYFDANNIEEAVGIALHATIHEINHTTASGEGAAFTGELAKLYGLIYGSGKYGLYEGLFRSVFRKHFETYKQLKDKYDESSTRNLSKSFDGDQLSTSEARDIQRNAPDVQTGQSTKGGYRGDTEDNQGDRTGDIILGFIGNSVIEDMPIKPGMEVFHHARIAVPTSSVKETMLALDDILDINYGLEDVLYIYENDGEDELREFVSTEFFEDEQGDDFNRAVWEFMALYDKMQKEDNPITALMDRMYARYAIERNSDPVKGAIEFGILNSDLPREDFKQQVEDYAWDTYKYSIDDDFLDEMYDAIQKFYKKSSPNQLSLFEEANIDYGRPKVRQKGEAKAIYSAVFFNSDELEANFPAVHVNKFYHHSTIEFKPDTLQGFPIGSKGIFDVIGRLTTDKVDVLLIRNPSSTNRHPHITLSTAEGVKPFESNAEIEANLHRVEPIHDKAFEGTYGIFNGKTDIVTSGEPVPPLTSPTPKPREYTPDEITSLGPNEVFVFGSNAEGKHGKGAALIAKKKFGAIQGQAQGIQGQSYAIVTKKNWRVPRSSSLTEIQEGIDNFLGYAIVHPDKKFFVTKIGTENAGYTVDEIKTLFNNRKDNIPDNVVLPQEFEVRDGVPALQPPVTTPTRGDNKGPATQKPIKVAPTKSRLLSRYIIPEIGNEERLDQTLRAFVYLVSEEVFKEDARKEKALTEGTPYRPASLGTMLLNVKKQFEKSLQYHKDLLEDWPENDDLSEFTPEDEAALKLEGNTSAEIIRDRINGLSAVLANYGKVVNLSLVKLKELGLTANVSRRFITEEEFNEKRIAELAISEREPKEEIDMTEDDLEITIENTTNSEDSLYELIKINKDARLFNDPKNTVSFRFKMFLSRIVDHEYKDGQYIAKKTFLGTNMYVDYAQLHNSISLDLADTKVGYKNMIETLKAKINNNPYYPYLIEKLESKDGVKYRSEFVNTFAKHYKDNTGIRIKNNENKNLFTGTPVSHAANSAFFVALEHFAEHQKLMPIAYSATGDNKINPEVYADIKRRYKAFIDDYNKLWQANVRTHQPHPTEVFYRPEFLNKMREFLSEIGIDIDMQALRYIADNCDKVFLNMRWHTAIQPGTTNTFAYNLFNFTSGITPEELGEQASQEEDEFESHNPFDYAEEFTKGNPLFAPNSRPIVLKIASVQASFGERNLAHTFVDNNGYINYAMQDYECTSNTVRKLKDPTDGYLASIVGVRDGNSRKGGTNFGRESIWGDDLIQSSVARQLLEVTTFDSVVNSGIISERETASASTQDLIAILLFQNKGIEFSNRRVARFIGITNGDNSTTPVYTFFAQRLEARIGDDLKVHLGDKTVDLLMKKVMSEANRIQYWQSHNLKTNTEYDKGANYFILSPFLNKSELEKRVNAGSLTRQELESIWPSDKFLPTEEGWKVIRRLVTEDMTERIDRQFDSFVESDIIKLDKKGTVTKVFFDNAYMVKVRERIPKLSKAAKYAVADFVVNMDISNAEQYKLIYTDPAIFFKPDKDGNLDLGATLDATQKRARGLVSPFIVGNFDKPTYNRVTSADDERLIAYAKQMAKVSGEKDYLQKVRIGDGFEITTAEEDILFRLAYDEIDKEIGLSILKKIRDAKADKNNPTNFFTLEGREREAVLQPIKPFSFSHKAYPEFDIVYPLFTKSSAIALYPFMTEGLPIDDLRVAMENSNVDRISYKTADKTITPSVAPLFNADGTYNTETLKNLKNYSVEMSRDGFGQQVKTPTGKRTVVTSSQVNSMLFVDVPRSTMFNLYGEEYTRDQFIRLKGDIRTRLFEIGRDKLFKEMGIVLANDGTPIFTSLEKIRNALIKQADKLPIYNIKDIESLGLTADGKHFIIPNYFSGASEKIEALFLSLVKDRIVNQELFGKGLIQAPSTGFTKGVGELDFLRAAESLPDEHPIKDLLKARYNAGIIYMEGYDPTQPLQFLADKEGNPTYAQLIVSPYFKTIDGKQIDIRVFRKMGENGRFVIDMEKVPVEVRRALGYRVPFLSHSNGCAVEIVGFLPPQFSDLVIMPDGITIQSGSDFDYDKLYSYLSDCVYDESTGKMIKVSEEHEYWHNKKELTREINDKIDALEKERKTLRKAYPGRAEASAAVKKAYQNKLAVARRLGSTEEINAAQTEYVEAKKKYNAIDTEAVNKTSNLKDEIYGLKRKLKVVKQFTEERVLKQKYADINTAVFANESLRELVAKPLVNKDMQSVLDDLPPATPQSPTSWEYQRDSYISQYTGKSLVAIIARSARISALLQQQSGIHLTNKFGKKIYIGVGGHRLSNLSGFGHSVDGKITRSKHDNIVTFGNAAVDNASNPILGRLNVNNETIQAVIAMCLLESDGGDSMSSAYIADFMTQPIIVDYVKEIDKLKRKSLLSRNYIPGDKIASHAAANMYDKYRKMVDGELDETIGADGFSRQELKEMRNNKEAVPDYGAKQISILEAFMRLRGVGTNLQTIGDVTLINGASGLGSSYADVVSKLNSLNKMVNSTSISNLASLVGDVRGGSFGGDVILIPHTEEGHLFDLSVNLVKDTFMQFGEALSPDLKIARDTITAMTFKDATKKDIKRINDSIKRFIYSGMPEVLGVNDVTEERKRLFGYGTKSLAARINEYQNDVKKGKATPHFFLSLIKPVAPKSKGDPWIVKFQGIRARGLSTIDITVSLANMLYSQDERVVKIAEDLFNYAIINGAFRHRDQFLQYFPMGWLQYRGVDSALRRLDFGAGAKQDSYDVEEPIRFEPYVDIFAKQYFQHYPYLAPKIMMDEIDAIKDKYEGAPKTFYINTVMKIKSFNVPSDSYDVPPQFLFMTHPVNGSPLLYERLGQVNNTTKGASDKVAYIYKRIDVLGSANYNYRGTSEFNAKSSNATSLFRANKSPQSLIAAGLQPTSTKGAKSSPDTSGAPLTGRPSIMSATYLPPSEKLQHSLKEISRSANTTFSTLAKALSEIMDRLPNDFRIVSDTQMPAFGRHKVMQEGDKVVAVASINPLLVDKHYQGDLQNGYERVILHESVHGITDTVVYRFTDREGRGNTTYQNILCRKLDSLRLEAIEKLREKGVDIDTILKNIERKKKSNKLEDRALTPNERLYAGLTSLTEFVADIMTFKGFIVEMSQIESTLDFSEFERAELAEKSIFQRVLDLVTALIKSIAESLRVNIPETSVAYKAIKDVASLLYTVERIEGESSTPFDLLTAYDDGKPRGSRAVVDALNNRLLFLKRGITGNTSEEERSWREHQIALIEEEIEKNKATSFGQDSLVAIINRQLDYAQSLVDNPDASPSELLFALDLSDMWKFENSQYFISVNSAIDPTTLMNKVLSYASSRAEQISINLVNTMRQKLIDIVNSDFVEGNGRGKIDMEDLMEIIEPNILKVQTLHLGRLGNKLGDFIYQTLYNADKNQIGFGENIQKTITDMFNRLKENPAALVKIGKDWDLFWQKDEEGNVTNGMVNELADKYFREKEANRIAYENANENFKVDGNSSKFFKAREVYFSNLRKMDIVVDLRFYFVPGFKRVVDGAVISDPADYKKYLVKYLGKETAEIAIEEAKKKYAEYQSDEQDAIDEILNDDSVIDKDKKIALWRAQHNPLLYLDSIYPVQQRTRHNVKREGKQYIYSKPRRYTKDKKGNIVDTGYYDSNYQKVMEDPVLARFYGEYRALMNELINCLPKYIGGVLPSNFLANIQKDIIETYNREGAMAALAMATKRSLDSVLGEDISLINEQIEHERRKSEVKPSGEMAKRVPIKFVQPGAPARFKIGDDIYFRDKLGATYKNGIAIEELEYKKASIKYMSENKSRDIEKLIRLFADMAVNYRYKTEVEDVVLMAKRILNEAKEIQTRGQTILLDNAGSTLSKKGGLMGFKQAVDYAMDSILYGQRRNEYTKEFGVVFDTANPIEWNKKRKRMRELELEWKKAERAYHDVADDPLRTIDEKNAARVVWNERIVELETEYEQLGGRKLVLGKIGDKLVAFTQLKGLALNVTAGIANIGFGTVSNMIHAAARVDFAPKQFHKAMGIMLTSIKDIKATSKATNLIRLYDIVFEVRDTVYGKEKERTTGKTKLNMLSKLDPYVLQTKGEFFVQGSAFIAKMLYTYIETKEGKKINLYEAYDANGNWRSDLFDEETNKEWSNIVGANQTNKFTKFRNAIIALNQRNHGNYDPTSAVPLKRYWIGRALIQFRNWIPEGFASRLEARHYDPMLDREVMGRWTMYQQLGPFRALHMMIQQMNPFNHDPFVKPDGTALDEVEKESMRKNLAELQFFAGMLAAYVLLKASLDDDDDNEFRKYVSRITLAILWRVSADITFYISPGTFFNIIKNPVPVARTVMDFQRAIYGTYRYLYDDDYRGDHPLKKWGQAFPITNEPIRLNYLATNTERKGLF